MFYLLKKKKKAAHLKKFGSSVNCFLRKENQTQASDRWRDKTRGRRCHSIPPVWRKSSAGRSSWRAAPHNTMLQEITGDSVREQAVLGKQILCSLAAVPFPLWWMLWRPSLRLGWKPSMKQVTAEECQQRSLLSSEVTAHPQNHTKEFDTATLTFHSFQDTKFPTPWNLPTEGTWEIYSNY